MSEIKYIGLSFKKDVNLIGLTNGIGIIPITENDEEIKNVLACQVSSAMGEITTMTITVKVEKSKMDKIIKRLTK